LADGNGWREFSVCKAAANSGYIATVRQWKLLVGKAYTGFSTFKARDEFELKAGAQARFA